MIVLEGRKGDVGHLAFSPDGRILAASGGRRGLELWDVAAGNLWGRHSGMHFADGPTFFHPTLPLCFAPAGGGVAEIETDTKKGRLVGIRGQEPQAFTATAMIPDGSGFVCWLNGSFLFDGHVRRFKWKRGEELREVWSAAVAPKGKRTGGLHPQEIRVRPGGKTFLTLDSHDKQGPLRGVRELVRVTIRAVKDGEILQQAELPAAAVPAVALSPDGKVFVTCHTNAMCVWRADDLGAEPWKVKSDTRARLRAVAFHPSGKYLAAAGEDTTIKFYDTATWKPARSFTWDIGKVRSVAFSPDGTLAAAGGDTGKVVVWDVDL